MIQVKAMNLYRFHLLNPLQSFRGEVLYIDMGKMGSDLCKIEASGKLQHGFCKKRVQLNTSKAYLTIFVHEAALSFLHQVQSEQVKSEEFLRPALIPLSVVHHLILDLRK